MATPVLTAKATAMQAQATAAQVLRWPRVLVIGLVSAGGIAFEITLTRVFSLLFQYHYVFLAVSLAILGLSLGAALMKLIEAESSAARTNAALQRVLLALGLSFPLCAFVIANLPSTVSIALHVLVALIPFVLVGAASALIFARAPQSSGVLYAADLLGAAVGVGAALLGLGVLGAFNVICVLGALAALAALLNTWHPVPSGAVVAQTKGVPQATSWMAPALCVAFSVSLLAVNVATGFMDTAPTRVADAPPDKTMLSVLRDPSQSPHIVYSAWDPFARVDVVETSDETSKFVFTDGGAGSYMLRYSGDLNSVAELRDTLEYLPFVDANVDRTLILGAGAGKDVLLALLAHSSRITALEVNPAMVEATRRFGDYNGHIFDQPQVQLHVGDARTFTAGSAEQYDLIYLNLVYSQAAPPVTQALAENYVFTREAFRAYLAHLAPGGRLAIVTHNGIEGTRAAITAIAALSDLGTPLPQTLDHLALLMRNDEDATRRTSVMILARDPLNASHVQTLSTASQALGMQPLHLPGIFDLGFKPLKNGQSLERFLSIDTTYELFPTSDNQPFFYKLDPGVPAPITQAVLLTTLLALLVLLLLIGQRQAASVSTIAYLAAIGLGFMLIEIPLIQRFQLLLGYPALTFALVLGTLLLAGGVGSWLSQRWPIEQLMRRVRLIAVGIAALGVLYALVLPPVLAAAVALPVVLRGLLGVLLTAPLGVLMGIPFPSVLRVVSAQSSSGRVASATASQQTHTSLLWAVNGAFSALGSTLAMLLAMVAGFQWATLLGVVAYLSLLLFARQRNT
jgi:spermidine synthase